MKKDNRGFLLAESLIVSTLVLTIIIFLFSQFKNVIVNQKRSYAYNNVEDIYSLGAMSDFLSTNDVELSENGYIYQNNSCTNFIPNGIKSQCNSLVGTMKAEYIIYTDSELSLAKEYFKSISASQDIIDFVNRIEDPKIEFKGRLFAKFKNGNFATIVTDKKITPIIRSWSNDATTDFHAAEYKTNIISAEFLDSINIPASVPSEHQWDVSAKGNESVMAWVVPAEEDSTKYKLYIAGDGAVIANQSSSYLFRSFSNLKTIKFNDVFDTSNVTSMSYMFYGCQNLTQLDIGNWDISNVRYLDFMFYNCRSLTSLDVSNFNTSKVTRMESMFTNCSGLTSLDVSKWDTSKVTNMGGMFSGCKNLTQLDVSKWDTSKVTNMWVMFYECQNITQLDVSKWDVSNVTDMNSMFARNKNITQLDVSKWNTSKAINMSTIFYNCSSLASLDVSKWDTSNATDMSLMFYGCSGLTSINVSNFNTSKVTKMESMFAGCSGLTSLDVSKWDVSNVTNMSWMFGGCSKLGSLNLSKWNTSNVQNMNTMFASMTSLKTLDLSSFDTSKVTTMGSTGINGGMFNGCTNLTTIYVSDKFVVSQVTNSTNMFLGASKLVGGNGTTYNSSHIDKEYARIDKAGQKGYFTLKS